MKKHPIDEAFAKKLAEHRQEPSQRALERFQERLAERNDEKRTVGFFSFNRQWGYYAAAASVIVALTIGILSQKNQQTPLAIKQPESTKEAQIIDNQADKNQIAVEKSQKGKFIENSAEKKQSILPISFSEKTSIAKIENRVSKESHLPIDADNSPEIEIAITETQPSIFSETPNKIETIQPKETDIFRKDIGDSIVLVFSAVEEQTIIPQISEDNLIDVAAAEKLGKEQAEDEKSFISKLFTEYKHFKYGEKIDLAKLGINKKEVLARVDERYFKDEREEAKEFIQRRFGKVRKTQD